MVCHSFSALFGTPYENIMPLSQMSHLQKINNIKTKPSLRTFVNPSNLIRNIATRKRDGNQQASNQKAATTLRLPLP
jgi:hypothetical protein